MFFDLSIPARPDAGSVGERLLMLQKLGYGGAAVTQTLIGKVPTQVPNMTGVPLAVAGLAPTFRQYSRVNVHLDDQKDAFVLNGTSPHLRGFDIVAVRPSSEKLFAQCCGTLDIDIISLDLSARLPYFLKVPPVRQAIERGVHFEICYSAAIRDSTARRNLIGNTLSLVRIARGRNIILSSEAESAMLLRAPYDVCNLTRLFGFDLSAAKSVIQSSCRAVLLHAEMRAHTLKGVLSVSISAPSEQPMDTDAAAVKPAAP